LLFQAMGSCGFAYAPFALRCVVRWSLFASKT
jgi:hypothetical protein